MKKAAKKVDNEKYIGPEFEFMPPSKIENVTLEELSAILNSSYTIISPFHKQLEKGDIISIPRTGKHYRLI